MTAALSASLWHHTCRETPSAPELADDVEADLLVIGGGYTGLSAALQAAQDGARVCLLEAQSFGSGGSGRNVGLVNAGLWMPPEDIEALMGVEAGTRLSQLLAAAPDQVFDLIARHNIACEPVRHGTLHCAHAARGLRDLENRYRQLAARGAPVQMLAAAEARTRVGSDQVHGALFDPRAGTIQPLAYARGLARAATEAGALMFEHSPALTLERNGDLWVAGTPGGTASAPRLIVAGNAYLKPVSGLPAPGVVPVHYFQAATDPLPDNVLDTLLPGKEGCWDTALIMSSWRLDQAGRLILGAMGDLGHLASGAHRNWLDRKRAALFPALADMPFRHHWFGRIAMTTEHLPKILSLGDSALMVFGYSGRGIGPGTVFGQHMAKALLSGDRAGLPVTPVDSHDLPFAGLKQCYYEAGATLTHLIKDRI